MLVDEHREAATRISAVLIALEEQPMDLGPAEYVVAHERAQNFNISIGDHSLTSREKSAEAP